MYKKTVNEILSKEISRKEFLRAGGAILLAIIGIPALINTISNAFTSSEKSSPKLTENSAGYGARPYGR